MNKEVQKLIKRMEDFTYNNDQFDSIRLERIDCLLLLNRMNKLQEENKKLKEHKHFTMQDALDEALDRIDIVSQRIGDFRLIYSEDGHMISSSNSIMVKLRYYRALLDGKIPLNMTPYEYSIWEKENRKGDTDSE